jgi:hypothetical protein
MPKRVPQAVARGKEILAPLEAIRKHTLLSLLDDLADLEQDGLSPEDCARVKRAIERVANAASEIPDGSMFRGTILHEVETFADVYRRWNGHEGRSPKNVDGRRSALKKLRKARQQIARRIHINQHILQHELDLKLIDATYEAFRDLVKSGPSLFKNLARTLARQHAAAS